VARQGEPAVAEARDTALDGGVHRALRDLDLGEQGVHGRGHAPPGGALAQRRAEALRGRELAGREPALGQREVELERELGARGEAARAREQLGAQQEEADGRGVVGRGLGLPARAQVELGGPRPLLRGRDPRRGAGDLAHDLEELGLDALGREAVEQGARGGEVRLGPLLGGGELVRDLMDAVVQEADLAVDPDDEPQPRRPPANAR
jgi:hypothetical protein